MIGQIILYSGGRGANRNVLGKRGMKLAIQGLTLSTITAAENSL